MVKLKEVIGELQSAISGFSNDGMTQPSAYRDNFLIRIESEGAFRALVEKLNDLINSEEEASAETLQSLIQFLADRYEKVKDTDSIYNHTPLTLANRACLHLAKVISQITNIPRYDLLYPHLKTNDLVSSKGHFNDLEPWEFIIADDGTPVDVKLCLMPLMTKSTEDAVLKHTHKSGDLTIEESRRVIHQTQQGFDIYANYEDETAEKLSARWKPLSASDVRAECTYGDAGIELQKKRIGINSLEALAEYLKNTADKNQWKVILEKLLPESALKNVILSTSTATLCEQVRQMNHYRDSDPLFNRAIIYGFIELYIRERRRQDTYKTTLGKLSFYTTYVGGYSKEEKIAAAEHYQKFLLTDQPLNQWEAYFKTQRLEKHIAPLVAGKVDYTTSELPAIVAQGSALANPETFAPAKKATSYFGF